MTLIQQQFPVMTANVTTNTRMPMMVLVVSLVRQTASLVNRPAVVFVIRYNATVDMHSPLKRNAKYAVRTVSAVIQPVQDCVTQVCVLQDTRLELTTLVKRVAQTAICAIQMESVDVIQLVAIQDMHIHCRQSPVSNVRHIAIHVLLTQQVARSNVPPTAVLPDMAGQQMAHVLCVL
jgi:hypothetical protein